MYYIWNRRNVVEGENGRKEWVYYIWNRRNVMEGENERK